MAKEPRKLGSAHGQMSLLDLLQQEQADRQQQRSGRLNVTCQLNTAIALAIKDAPKSRETICDEMTELLGVKISINMLNSWTAESKEQHRFPAEYLPAFCIATGSIEPMRILAEAAGVYTLPGPDALRAEIQKHDERIRELQAEKKRRQMFLHELEAKR